MGSHIKIGVISDTHIPDRAKELPSSIREVFKGVDMIIHAGDFVDLSVLEELQSLCKCVKGVWGNMDPPEVRSKLPEKEIFKIGKHTIGLIHGQGAPAMLLEFVTEKFKKDNVDVIIFGHAHTPFNEVKDGILFFNPGSATDRIFAPFNSFGIIEINDTIDAKIVKI